MYLDTISGLGDPAASQTEMPAARADRKDFNPLTFLNRKLKQLLTPASGAIDKVPGLTSAQRAMLKDRPVDGLLNLMMPAERLIEDTVREVNHILHVDRGRIKLPNGVFADMNPRPDSDNVFARSEREALQRVRMTLELMLYVFYAKPVFEIALAKTLVKHGIINVDAFMAKIRSLPKPPGPALPAAPTPDQVADMFRRIPGLGAAGADDAAIGGTILSLLSAMGVAAAGSTPPAVASVTLGVAKIASDKARADQERAVRAKELETKASAGQATPAEVQALEALQAEIQAESAAGADVPGGGGSNTGLYLGIGIAAVATGLLVMARR